ncbi:hypothetical protein [Aquimarina sediminis]|uniref:hypothetical protein n=1 Tax=Aquimarina sediminis TaxID=2070536 RepID=UPI000FFE6C5A|nr:hypothetical protein [Aquimarina sediminis]
MILRILPILLLYFVQAGYAFSDISYDEKIKSSFVKNTIKQLDYLVDHNQKAANTNDLSSSWYIYIAGGTLEELKYIIDKTKDTQIRNEYLTNLNNHLIKLNSYSTTAVYVAFTDYENKILTPIFPSDMSSMAQKESYITKLIKNKDFSERSEKELKTFLTFSQTFRDLVVEVYKGSKLSKSDKPNILLPFTNYSIREVIRKVDSEDTYIKSKGFSYTLYTPKLEKPLEKGKFKTIYNNRDPEFGLSNTEQKIAKVIKAITVYFHEDFDYKDCEELLAEYRNKPIMTEFPEFRRHAENNPCILKNIVPWGEDIEKSEWMTMTETLIAIPLYIALAIPAASIAGTEALRQIGKEKAKEISIAVATNIAIQTITNYYFGGEEITSIKDDNQRWHKAFLSIDKFELGQEVLDAAYSLSTRHKLVLACLQDGIKIENMNWETMDASNAKVTVDLKGCVQNVVKYIFIDGPTDKALGYVFKRLSTLIKKNPKEFMKAWRKLSDDFGPTFKKDLRTGVKEYKDDLFKALGVSNSLDKKIAKYIKSSFKVEEELGESIEEYVSEISNEGVKNTIKDIAADTETNINDQIIENVSGNISRKIKKQGANITLEVTIKNGDKITIRVPLLEELEEGGQSIYRIVFENNKKSLDDISGSLTSKRQNVVKAMNNGDISSIVAKGGNADKHLGIRDKPITVTDIDLRTVNQNGDVISKNIGGKNTSGQNIGGRRGELKFANDIIKERYDGLIELVPQNLKSKLDDIVRNVSYHEVNGEILMDLFLGSERSNVSGLIDRFNLSTNEKLFDDLLNYISKHKNNATQISSVSSYLDGVNDMNILNKIITDDVPVEHIFRGTSQNFGGKGNAAVGITSTSVDPASSVIFGLNSDYLSGGKGVLKVSDVNSLKNVDLGFPNILSKSEMELALEISPSNFSNYVTKEIPIEQARQALKNFGIDLPSSSSFKTVEDVAYYIENTRKLTPKEVTEFMRIINN